MNHAHVLFGGALLAAGFAADRAHAQEFDFPYRMVDLYAFGAGTLNDDGAGFWGPTTHAGTACTAYAYGGPTDVILEAICGGTPLGGAASGVACTFTVSEPALLTLTWDFSGVPSTTGGIGTVQITHGTTGAPVIYENYYATGTPLTGVASAVIEADQLYVMLAGVSTLSAEPSLAWLTLEPAPCFADCDGNGLLNVDDIDCFVAAFTSGDPNADCDGNGALNVDDIDCFVAIFLDGCP